MERGARGTNSSPHLWEGTTWGGRSTTTRREADMGQLYAERQGREGALVGRQGGGDARLRWQVEKEGKSRPARGEGMGVTGERKGRRTTRVEKKGASRGREDDVMCWHDALGWTEIEV